MHEKIMQNAKELITEVENIGCDNLSMQQIERMMMLSKFFKNMICAEKDYLIVKSMENAETLNVRSDMHDAETYIDNVITETMKMFSSAIPEVRTMARQKFENNLVNRI